MRRTRILVGLVALAAVGLLLIGQVAAAEQTQGKAASSQQWDEPTPSVDHGHDVAMAGGDQFGPPGPPPDGDDDRPPPPRDRDGDHRKPGGPDGKFGPPREGGPDGDRPQGPPPGGEFGRRGPGGQGGDRDFGPPSDKGFDRGGPGRDRGPDAGPGQRPPRNGGPEGMPPRDGGPQSDRQPRGTQDRLDLLEKVDPELFKVIKEERELDKKSHELAMQYRRATSAERDSLKRQIEETVSKQFDVRQQKRELELKRLEKELQRLRESVEKRNQVRKDLIERRVSELIGREEEVRF